MATFKITVAAKGLREDTVKKVLEALGAYVTVAKRKDNPSRAERLEEAEQMIDEAKGIIEGLSGEMRDWYDNLPENLQGSDKGSQVEECAEKLDEIFSELDNLDLCVDFPGMY